MSAAKKGAMKATGYGENLLNLKTIFHAAKRIVANLQSPDRAVSTRLVWRGKQDLKCDLFARGNRLG